MLTEFTPFTFAAATPESVGISSASIAEFERRIREAKLGHQGYMLYRHGKLATASIAAPYRFSDKRHVYSVSKSYTSTAVGIACDEGLISVEDSVISYFPELLPETVSENLAAMKIKHLLSMNTGHQNDTLGRAVSTEPEWAKRFLSLPVENAPGTHFAYNTTATYMLSAIITKVTGLRMVDYLRPRLFNPLGIENVSWEESPEGISDGGWGIHVSPEDMLKLGILYLNKGVWNGRRILSERWVSEASSFQSDNGANKDSDWNVGYGYQFWRCRHDCYRADGAFGQFIVVSPATDSVFVAISEDGRMQPVLDIYWDTIFAAMGEPLPETGVSYDTAVRPFMELPVYSRQTVAPVEFSLANNSFGVDYISLRTCGDLLAVRFGSPKEHSAELICGAGKWEYNKIPHCPLIPAQFLGPLASGVPAELAAAWGESGEEIRVSVQFVTTPHGLIFDFDLAAGKLAVSRTIDHGASRTELTLNSADSTK